MTAAAMFCLGVMLVIALTLAGLWLIGAIDFFIEDDLEAPPKQEVRRVRAGPVSMTLTKQEQEDVCAAARRAAYSEAFFGVKAINPHPSGHPLFVPWAIALAEAALELQEQQSCGLNPY